MSSKIRKKRNQPDIYDQYRRILAAPDLAKREIDEMRRHLGLLARTICEHVWKKKIY